MARASLPRQATTPSRSTSGPASTHALTSARCSASSLRRRPERGWSPSTAGPPVRSRASQRYRVARPMPPARAALSTAMPSRTLAIARSRTRLRGLRSTRAKARSSVALTIPISTSAGGRKTCLRNFRKPYNIFTPTDNDAPEDERPYGGYLYGLYNVQRFFAEAGDRKDDFYF